MTPALVLCAVLWATDGDTLRVAHDCPVPDPRIRIADIDAPERGCGPWRRSREALAVLAGEAVWVLPLYQDRWGRTVADLATVEHEPIAPILIDMGLARSWRHDDRGRAIEPRPVWECD